MDVNDAVNKVGFLESNFNRKSNSRLTVAICSGICIFATLVEGSAKIISVVKGAQTPTPADWAGIAVLVGALLIGNGALKAAQRLGIDKTTKPVVQDESAA